MAKGREDYAVFLWLICAVILWILTGIMAIVGGSLLGVGVRDTTMGLIIAGGVLLGLGLLFFVGGFLCCRKVK